MRAQLEQAKDRLAKTSVYSPIDGRVTSLDIEVGETAISSTTNIPGSTLMTIANPASILTEVNVDEADIAKIDAGQAARIYAIAYPDQPVDGVGRLDRRVREGRGGPARLELRGEDSLVHAEQDHVASRHVVPRGDLRRDPRQRARRADPSDLVSRRT